VRLLIVSPDSTGTACPLSGRNSTYRPVQISGAGSLSDRAIFDIGHHHPFGAVVEPQFLGDRGRQIGDLGAEQR
jgi:hypothetical protein